MAIIKRKRGNVIYLCEVIYTGTKKGKQHYKEKVLGHLDQNGNLIPSKKMRRKNLDDFPAQVQMITTTTTKIRLTKPKSDT